MAKTASLRIEITEVNRLHKALRVLAEDDAPYMRARLEQAGRLLTSASASRAPGSIASTVQFAGVKGRPWGMRATVVVKHPGAKAREFGRQTYYRGYTKRRMKATGSPFKTGRGGQKPDPFIGIVKGNAALGAVEGEVKRLIALAVHDEWERLGAA